MDPIAFRIGNLSIHWYGVLVAAGFLAGLWTASRRASREGVSAETTVDLGPWLMVGAIVGARLWHVVSYWQEEFADQPWWEMFMIHHGGLVFYGGFFGAVVAVLFFVRARGLALWKLADVLAPSIALGQTLGRLGCFMNGCCYGVPTSLPWAVHYPADNPTHGAGVHPTQLYEAGLDLALYAFLVWFHPRKKFDGHVFALYLVVYPILRGGVEFLRGDYDVLYLGGWATPAHLVGLLLLAVGLWFLRRPPAHPWTPRPPTP